MSGREFEPLYPDADKLARDLVAEACDCGQGLAQIILEDVRKADALKWTAEKPTIFGWYFAIANGSGAVSCGYLDAGGYGIGGTDKKFEDVAMWCGPIPFTTDGLPV